MRVSHTECMIVELEVYLHGYVSVCACVFHVYVCMHACMCVCMHVCVYACVYVCMHACMCICVCCV